MFAPFNHLLLHFLKLTNYLLNAVLDFFYRVQEMSHSTCSHQVCIGKDFESSRGLERKEVIRAGVLLRKVHSSVSAVRDAREKNNNFGATPFIRLDTERALGL